LTEIDARNNLLALLSAQGTFFPSLKPTSGASGMAESFG
jgi:hypothetical protein